MTVVEEVEIPEPMVHAEEVHAPERLIVSPAHGVYRPPPPELVTAEGEIVEAGQAFGLVEQPSDDVTVLCPHTGFLMGMLVLPGGRVREHQPLAWVRVFE